VSTIGVIAGVTVKALVSRRRALLMVGLVAVPVLLALLARWRGLPGDPIERTAQVCELLLLRTVLPLVALVFGTSALGAELEDGTAIHLLTKPVSRWRIVAGKIAAAAPITMALTVGATITTGLIIGGDRGAIPVTMALAVAVAIGALLYVTVFVALSVLTPRALILGLLYVVIWEGLLAGLFAGTQAMSIRQYTMSIAAALDPSGAIADSAPLAISTAVPAAIIVLIGGFAIASRRLSSLELTAGD
jgi:ABC-2 type transport system permease protein